MAARILCIGECMVELSAAEGGLYRLGFGGDTLNACVLMARLAGPNRVGYVTRLGGDGFGARMRAAWTAEGVETEAVEIGPDQTTGLYAIETDAAGERSFTYWRGQAAARGLFTEGDWCGRLAAIRAAELVFFSGISLAILPPEGRERLLEAAAAAASNGALVAVDPNFRPRLWPAAEAAEWIGRAYGVARVALTSREEEATLFGGGESAAPERDWALARAERLGVAELVLKRGAEGAAVVVDGRYQRIAAAPATRVVDTTGAGDAFDAGYLWARSEGRPPARAAVLACALGAAAVEHPGAIAPASATAAVLARAAAHGGDSG